MLIFKIFQNGFLRISYLENDLRTSSYRMLSYFQKIIQ